MSVDNLQELLRKFADERDWNQFHTPRNLILAIQAELGELSELVQWVPDSEINEQWIQDNNWSIHSHRRSPFRSGDRMVLGESVILDAPSLPSSE